MSRMNFNYDATAPLMAGTSFSASNHPIATGHLLKFIDPVRHRKVLTEHKALKEVKSKSMRLLGK